MSSMAESLSFWLLVSVSMFLTFVLGLIILTHNLPLLLKLSNVPKGTFGLPLLGETLGFLKPHSSNSIGKFLQDHCSR